MITTQTLVAGLITMKHGHAVAEQFEATFSYNEFFENQNLNALTKIEATVRELFESNLLGVEENDALEDYLIEIRDFLPK